jgi:hypothetical protein
MIPSQTDWQQIFERLEKLTPKTHSLWGRMNAGQMICHLDDAYLMSLGKRPVSEDIGFLGRTLVRWVALHSNITWPKGVKTRPESDQSVGGTPPADFETDKARLIANLEAFLDPSKPFQGRQHPIFGKLTDEEWLRWGYRHADHHLRQFGQ